MPDHSVQNLTVSPAEAGQKLLSYLKRRLGQNLPDSLLHRIIRSGEVRVNHKRCKPFDRLEEGDEVRIPPLRPEGGCAPPSGTSPAPGAKPLDPNGELVGAIGNSPAPQGSESKTTLLGEASPERRTGRATEGYPINLNIIAETPEYLIINKPAGLPSQPGSGHSDSLSSRLAAIFSGTDFTPTPAHRLDKSTSGIILAAKTYRALRAAQDGFREHTILKDYLAWVEGNWPEKEPVELHDLLEKQDLDGKEKVTTGAGKEALCRVDLLSAQGERSLLRIRLFTGRTHQIRVQLSSRGFPIIGDVKYDGPKNPQGMFLHAWRLALPGGESFSAPPPWEGEFTVPSKLLDSEEE